MKTIYKRLMVFLAIWVLAAGNFSMVFADHDDHEGNGRHQDRERNHSSEYDGKRNASVANPPVYTENCGGCHAAYAPGLLPSASWKIILNGLADHFGEAVELDRDSNSKISEYLKANAADHSSGEAAGKIMRSIGNQTPLRITEIPYIQKKHHDIGPDIWKRKSIGSLGNCSACHARADRGDFDDEQIEIPE